MSPSLFASRQESSNRPPGVVQNPAPTDPNKHYVLYHLKSTPPVASSPRSVHSGAELLSARTAHSSYMIMLEVDQPLVLLVRSNTWEILPHLSNLKLYSGPLPQHFSPMHHPPETRKRQAPIPFSTQAA